MQTELFPEEVFEHEPPLGSIVADAAAAGTRVRRRRTAGTVLAGVVAFAAVVAVAVPVLAHRPGGSGSVASPATRPSASADTPPGLITSAPLPPGLTLPLTAPTVPAPVAAHDPVPITAKSFAQLMLDVLPAGTPTTPDSLISTTDDVGTAAASVGVGGTDYGQMYATLTHPGAGALTCDPAGSTGLIPLACHVFAEPGGVSVMEQVDAGEWPAADIAHRGYDYLYSVSGRRADGVTVIVEAANYGADQSKTVPASARPPLSVAQVAAAATDPRWGWTAGRSYVAAAKALTLAGSPVG